MNLNGSTNSHRRIVGLLSSFGLLAYVLRMNISITAKFMMPALQLTQIQFGQIFSAFMVGYALFQVPCGVLGDRVGPRRVLTAAALLWAIATAFTGLMPGILAPLGVLTFASLLVLRFLLGASEAAVFPVAARAIASWLPSSQRAFSYSIVILGALLGSAFTAPIVASLMVKLGWRESFYVSSIFALLLAVVWYRYLNTHPESRASADKSASAPDLPRAKPEAKPRTAWLALLGQRNMLLICASYFLDSYVLFVFVFWLYLYLVEDRGFSVLKGGVYTSLPFLVAILFVPISGYLCDSLAARLGRQTGRNAVAMTALMLSAAFLLIGVRLTNPYHAIAGLALSVGFLHSTEPAFWSTSMDIGKADAGAAGGIMNMAGNLGGVVSTALVPVLVRHFGWSFAFGSASACAALASLVWVFIRIDNSLEVQAEHSSLKMQTVP